MHADHVDIDDPLHGRMPPSVARNWYDLDGSSLPEARGPARLQGIVQLPARVDIFIRREGLWEWTSAFRLTADHAVALPEAARIGVLVRYAASPLYSWGEGEQPARTIALTRMKTLRLTRSTLRTNLTLFVAGEITPRVVTPLDRSAAVTMLPTRDAIVCETNAGASHCATVGRHSTAHAFESVLDGETAHVFYYDGAAVDLRVQRPSRSSFRPNRVAAEATRAGEWIALRLPRDDEIVVDAISGQFFLQRFLASALDAPPSFAQINTPHAFGIAVRPQLGRHGTLPVEPTATIHIFTGLTGAAARIPVATLTADESGVFRESGVPGGTYAVKLASAMSDGLPVEASLAVGDVTIVRFPAGREIVGKVKATVGGAIAGGPRISVIRRDDATTATNIDLSDWANSVEGDSTGRFSLAVRTAGSYVLSARWGGGIAERTFTLDAGQRFLDVGDIVLTRAASLRGTIQQCASGELRLAPHPLADGQPRALRFTELRKTPLAADGTYFIGDLAPGTWLAIAVCGGRPTELVPSTVTIQGDTDAMFDAAARPEAQP